MAAKMIAARLMPEPQKTRKTFLGGDRYVSKRGKEKHEGGTWPLSRVSLVNFLMFISMLSAKAGKYLPRVSVAHI